MRFFRNAAGKKLPNELLESVRHMHSVWCGRSSERTPKKTSSRRRCSSKKDLKEDVRCSWNETFDERRYAFLQERSRKKTSKWASGQYTSHAFSLMWSDFRRRAQERRLRGGDVRAKKDFKEDVRCSWNKTFYITYYNRHKEKIQWWIKRHCVGHTFFSWEATLLQHNLTYLKFFSAGLIDKKKGKKNKTNKLMIHLSFVKLYFLSTYNYVQFNHINLDIKVFALPSATHVRLPNGGQRHAFLQERIQNAVRKGRKKPCAILRGCTQKMCVHSPRFQRWSSAGPIKF